jgi:hypothetical protein
MAGPNKSNNTVIRLLLILLAALALFGVVTYYNRTKTERFSASAPYEVASASASSPSSYAAPSVPLPMAQASTMAPFQSANAPAPLEPVSNERYRPVPGDTGGNMPNDPFPQDRVSPEDLLPKDAANSKWAQANPAGQGDLKDMNLLTAGYHMGVNTQGQSLRNASHDLRSEPVNPRYKVSIWNNATIEGDLNRRPLE